MHTPGKWYIHKYKRRGYSLHPPISVKSDIVSRRGNPTLIALLGTGTDERFANANLIAAAPALLEACKEVLEIMETSLPGDLMKVDGILIDVIAKAKE